MELLDLVLRPIAWLAAALVGISVVGACIGAAFAPMGLAARRGGGWRSVVAWLAAGPLFAIALVIMWRVARITGGYIGSSEFPLHHIVRFFS